jgi:general secretion pathway protein A
MYYHYYGLDEEPFQLTPDTKYAWLGEKHAEALAALEYAIQENKGFLVLTGDVGTGKTLMINCFLKKIGENVIAVKVTNPSMSVVDFFNFLSAKFGWKKFFRTKGNFLLYLEDYLYRLNSEGKRVLLIIDEAQDLDHKLIEEIRLLSNIELENKKLINIFFVGQNELDSILRFKENKAIHARIAIWCNIEPLSEIETTQYISHRLRIAGTTKEIFPKEVIRKIHSFSKGIPRIINILCDQALLSGFSQDVKEIETNIILKSANDLGFQFQERKIEKPKTDHIELKQSSVQNVPKHKEIKNVTEKRQVTLSHALGALSLVLLFIVSVLLYYARSLSLEEKEAQALNKYENKQVLIPEKQSVAPQRTQVSASEIAQDRQLGKNSNPTKTHKKNQIQTPEKQLLLSEATQISEYDITHELRPTQSHLTEEQLFMINEELDLDKQENAYSQESTIVKEIENPFIKNNLIVYFKHNSNELHDHEFAKLDLVAEYMKYNSDTKINVKGYTDNLGSIKTNEFISILRAINVKTYLIGKELDPSRIKIYGLGQKNPIAENKTEKGRRLNRRVEIELVMEN